MGLLLPPAPQPVSLLVEQMEYVEIVRVCCGGGSTDAARALIALPTSSERLGAVSEEILRIVHDVASVEIGASDPLMDSGIDSLAGVELKNKVEALYGVELPATAAFDYPNVEALAGYLTSQLDMSAIETTDSAASSSMDVADKSSVAAAAVSSPPTAYGAGMVRQSPSAVAVLGWSGSAPAAAAGFGATACPANVDGISVIPSRERWDHDIAGALDPAEP